jgi:hypothetical protein
LRRLQIGKDSLDCLSARLPAVAEVEDKTRIAHGIAAEASRGDPAETQELFYFS